MNPTQPQSKPKFSIKRIAGVATAVAVSSVSVAHADATITLPTVDFTNLLGFISLLVAGVATIATANLAVPMTAKGIKAIRAAF